MTASHFLIAILSPLYSPKRTRSGGLQYFDGSVRDCNNSIANTLELHNVYSLVLNSFMNSIIPLLTYSRIKFVYTITVNALDPCTTRSTTGIRNGGILWVFLTVESKQFVSGNGPKYYPTLGCDIYGFRTIRFNVQYRPWGFKDIPMIWLAAPRGANGAHLWILT